MIIEKTTANGPSITITLETEMEVEYMARAFDIVTTHLDDGYGYPKMYAAIYNALTNQKAP